MNNGTFTTEEAFAHSSEAPAYPTAKARRTYGAVGGALLGFTVATIVAANFLAVILVMLSPSLLNKGWVNSLLSLFSIDLVGGIVIYLLMRKTKAERPMPKSLSAKQLALLSLSSLGCMYAFNFITAVLRIVLAYFGIEAPTAVHDSLTQTSLPLALFSALIVAPILEELFYRRFVCDRLAKYGEWQAVLFSGLTFSLFHMNFEQLFYAFALGCIFAAVYIKTGKLRYTIIMHFIVNLVGTVPGLALIKSGIYDVADEMLSLVALGAIDVLAEFVAQNSVPAIVFMLFLFVRSVMSIACAVILLTQVKGIFADLKGLDMPKGERLKIMFSGKATIAYIIICIAFTLSALR